MAEEPVNGWTLEEYLQSQPLLPLAEVVRIGKETAEQLASTHDKVLITTTNIWLEDPDGRVKILDSGSPSLPIDAPGVRVDLGRVLYRMTTGRLPSEGPALEPVAALRPDAPPRLIAVIEDLLESKSADQSATTHKVIAELQAIERAFALIGMGQIGYDRSLISSRAQRLAFSFGPSPRATTDPTDNPASPAGPGGLRPRSRRPWFAVAAVFLAIAVGVVWFGNREWRQAAIKKEVATLCDQSAVACGVGSYHESLDLANRAIEKDPNNALAYARRARGKFFLGDERGALEDCDESLRLDPDLAIALAYRAPLAWLKNPATEGVENGERALQLDPNLAEGPGCLALAKLHAGDVSGAEGVATAAIASGNSDPESHRARGLARLAKGDATALADFHAALKNSGNQPFYLAARSEYYTARSTMLPLDKQGAMLALAQADADAALEKNEKYGIALVAKARVLAAKGRFPDSRSYCEQALAANPHMEAAYLRGADDLSPRQARRYQLLRDALMYRVDLRRLKGGGDFAFGSVLADISRLVSAGVEYDVMPYINFGSFPPEARQTLRDAKINLNTLMDATGENLLTSVTYKWLLENLCRQVDATFWVTPDNIEIVDLESAPATALTRSRLFEPNLSQPADLAKDDERRHFFEQALEQSLDLRELRGGGDFAFGSLLTDFQTLISKKMQAPVTLYIQYHTYPQESRVTLRDAKVNLNILMDATGENLLKEVKFGKILSDLCRAVGSKIRATSDFIEIVQDANAVEMAAAPQAALLSEFALIGPIANTETKEEPRFVKCKPRVEAINWLTRGIQNIPESAQLHFARAQVYLEMGDFDKAIADITGAIELKPGYPEAIRMLTIARAAKGKQLPHGNR